MVDFKKLQEKWKTYWKEQGTFESNAEPGKPKFFLTFPYPYMNGYLHMGHFYSIMRTEVFSRYKRMTGHNVLFPQGWHCTGSPIESVAKRIREGEPKQLEIMKKQGFSDEEVKQFGEPKYWTDFFPKSGKVDLQNLGLGIDFRRSFITTDLNPHYNKFIEWQFRKLKEGGYVVKGKHPVVWDPIENTPVGDHDRVEGEGETPQEYVLFKQQLPDGRFVISATLKPDTVLGVVNVFVHPDKELVEADVDGETWILSEKAAKELRYQDKKVEVKNTIKGTDIIGQRVKEFSGYEALILPATFVDISVGTGVVHGCPSDSADDLIALQDLQNDPATCEKYGLNNDEVKAIQPISIIDIPGYGDIPADDVIKKLGIKSQKDADKLKKAKEMLYTDGFYKGKFKDLYAEKFSQSYAGKPVIKHKDDIKAELVEQGFADIFYQLTGKVVARSLSECVVNIVDDQWFMNYSDEEWTQKAHKCLDQMKLYPEKSRQQFDYVLDWLQNWACVREVGLGTKLPWDSKWVIEALSDSTIYMAYYTIAHMLQEHDPEKITDEVFDYLFGDKEKPESDLPLEEMKKEFEYWYPMDFRNSGKDLIQNHLSFSIFNHVAIFPEKYWPQSFGVNGWVTVDGQKMSKSLGNFIMLKDLSQDYPVDGSRLTIMSGGEGMDDPNWDSEFAKSTTAKLDQLYEQCVSLYDKGRDDLTTADKWMLSQLNLIIKETTEFMDLTSFRSALQRSFFDLPRVTKQYLKKVQNNPNKEVMKQVIESQIKLLAPITPFITEELWEQIGKKGSVAHADWPTFDESQIDEQANYLQEMVSNVQTDITSVIKLVGSKPENITLFVADDWKYGAMAAIKKALSQTHNTGEIIKQVLTDEFKPHAKELTKLIPRLQKNASIMPKIVLNPEKETAALEEAKASLESEFSCTVNFILEKDSSENKASQALPGKPAILVN